MTTHDGAPLRFHTTTKKFMLETKSPLSDKKRPFTSVLLKMRRNSPRQLTDYMLIFFLSYIPLQNISAPYKGGLKNTLIKKN